METVGKIKNEPELIIEDVFKDESYDVQCPVAAAVLDLKDLDTKKVCFCYSCHKFFDIDAYREHARQKRHNYHPDLPPLTQFACNFCDRTYSDKQSWKAHEKLKHTGEETFICDVCGKAFATKTAIRYHLSSHFDIRPFECDKCGKSFTNPSNKTKHMEGHADYQYKCPDCPKCFRRKKSLRVHSVVHVPDRSRSFNCGKCSSTFHTVRNLKSHMIVHTDVRTYACEYCPQKFKAAAHLRNHTNAIHKKAAEKTFKCDICPKSFYCSKNLQTHKRMVHLGVKKHVCVICSKGFRRKDHCEVHVRTHTTNKPFACQYCDKRFNQKPDWQAHERIHTGARPFRCQYCEKTFARNNDRKRHELVHTGVKPHKCSICQHEFRLAMTLKSHIKAVHLKQKDFECEYCDRAFSRKHRMRDHMETHLKNETAVTKTTKKKSNKEER